MAIFTWFIRCWSYVERLKPQWMSTTPRFKFIHLHYVYVIGMTILGSIFLYPQGRIRYIDSLFFASGAATQSGLNTVDVNLLSTYQQVVCMVLAMMCNPIAINTFVVFLRLYWFEKRFQHVALEAKKNNRASISRSRSRTLGDLEKAREGVNGRSIIVMHNTQRPLSNDGADDGELGRVASLTVEGKGDNSGSSQQSSDRRSSDTPRNDQPTADPHPTGITFSDQVKRSDAMDDDFVRLPAQISREEHLRILERQRNPEGKGVLRIPGPRDADAGRSPEEVDEDESRALARIDSGGDQANSHMEPRRNIVIQEPVRPQSSGSHHRKEHVAQNLEAAGHTLGLLRFRKPKLSSKDTAGDDNAHSMSKTRVMSFSNNLRTALSYNKGEDMPYLSWQPTVGRNSAFADLTEEQREELGGIEYRSLKTLSNGLLVYFWGFTILGIVGLTPWIMHTSWGEVVRKDGQGLPWWGIFTSISAFTDLGYTLTPDSMFSFQEAVWPLLLMSFLIVIGNTGFPIMLRFLIWLTSIVVPQDSGFWEELQFLLDHPRRCFALLFPAAATWWLLAILIILNGVDLVLFIILDLGNTIVTQLPVHTRILDGWFQAVSTRTAGFGVVNLAALHPGIQVSYLVMMYISVLPIAMSVRRTNVYEEKSLGIYANAEEENEAQSEPSYVGAHLRRQLSFDLWYIFLGLFVVAIAEGKRIQDEHDQAFSMFAVLFEIVSAYGTVGLSLGYPTINASFSAEFGIVSKLVIIAMQIRGRHRGLPYELDRAILLPSESLHQKEDEIAARSIRRRNSNATLGTTTATSFYVNGQIGSRTSIGDRGKRQPSMSRGRTGRTFEKGTEFISGFLRPGPTAPNIGPPLAPRKTRRHSTTEVDSSRERGIFTDDALAEDMGNGVGQGGRGG